MDSLQTDSLQIDSLQVDTVQADGVQMDSLQMTSVQSSPDDAPLAAATQGSGHEVVEAAPEELNQWKRGFTPQAEIWNGRMAMVGLSVGLTVLLIARLSGHV